MEKEEMMRRIKEQERLLRFHTVSLSDLRKIGEMVAESISSKGATAYVMIRVNGLEVFALSLEGSSANNRGWALRKANAGGAFPILLSSGLCIGSIAVSGMPSEGDHQSICSALSEVLGIEVPSITE